MNVYLISLFILALTAVSYVCGGFAYSGGVLKPNSLAASVVEPNDLAGCLENCDKTVYACLNAAGFNGIAPDHICPNWTLVKAGPSCLPRTPAVLACLANYRRCQGSCRGRH